MSQNHHTPVRLHARMLGIPFIGLMALAISGCAVAAPPAGSSSSTEATEATAAAPLTGAECIVGSWLLDNDSFGELISSSEARVVDEVSGVARFIAEPDGTAVTEYIDWTHVIRMTDPEGVVTMVRNGKDTGVYNEEADGNLSLLEHTNASVIVSTISSQGMTFNAPEVQNSPGALHLAVFSCIGDKLTVTVEDRSSVMLRES